MNNNMQPVGGLHAAPIDLDNSDSNTDNDEDQQVESYPLASDETMTAPLPFAVPNQEEYRDPVTGRVSFIARPEHGILCRNQRVVLCAQGIPGLFHDRVLFVAQRQGRGQFAIFNVYDDNSPEVLMQRFSTEDPRYVGELKRTVKQHGHVHYSLLRSTENGSQEVATTIYNTASLYYPVVNGSPDRIAYSVIHDDTPSKNGNSNSLQTTPKGSVESLRDAHDHESIHAIVDKQDALKLFQSKRRFTDRRGFRVHADVQSFQQKYGGRALLPSKKNLQLMNVSSGKAVLQMARLNREEFSVDFIPPYTPFQAFGLALAQLDAN